VFSSLDDEDRYPFDSFDEEFFDLIKAEGGGFLRLPRIAMQAIAHNYSFKRTDQSLRD